MATMMAERAAAGVDAKKYWEGKAVAYDCLHDRLRLMVAEIAARRPGTLFDVGCAAGEVARAVERVSPGTSYFGCDISQSAVERLARPQVVRCDLNAEPVPFAGRRFECIVASGICEYVANLPAFMNQLSARLAGDGALLVSYVNKDSLGRRVRRGLGKRPRDNATWRPLVSLADFEAMLQGAGLSMERRLATHGRIEPTSDWAFRLSPRRAACRIFPGLLALLGAQVIYVCRPRGKETARKAA